MAVLSDFCVLLLTTFLISLSCDLLLLLAIDGRSNGAGGGSLLLVTLGGTAM